MTGQRARFRRAVPDDADTLWSLYLCGDRDELAWRLAGADMERSTVYHVVELDREVAAVFALTELGRLRPGSPRRVLLHEIKLKPSFRGRNVPEDVFTWLAQTIGAGGETDLIVLAPPVENPPLMADRGMVKAYHAFKWPASAEGVPS
ncbi:hypothetical protein [Amycolatopsis keratiniphila]|uniref:N-acetyltransferase domain-containing protein n=1 Tax=Amycolatopsis keratiniphila subsp. keratiniphila TaxID=227715 RepID=A0A1W2LSN1_9PSEU|nr:hypothetical protein [Amycolatopsis keratiniphila]ONF67867.1 hypothetical protein AVR91_0220690 [Amycolatopsis keratiniphila subsp. keratiniphila]